MSEHPATNDWQAPAGTVPVVWPAVPDHEILEELGRGGMGVVCKAVQVSLNRLVALKLIRDAALAGPEERARFRIEAEAAARMRHPNIVQIFEVGEHAGQPYFSMELIEGGGLDQLLAGRPQNPAQAAELLRTLALAIQHAHEQKIVHRDLKPANILLAFSRDAQRSADPALRFASRLNECVPKITDFGLAKRLDSQSTAWTQSGAILGTASYMSPEQAAGRSSEIGPAVDIYALGAILYELLTGRPPFRGDSWNQLLQQVLYDDAVPPSRLQGDVPRDLETICLKCLDKLPARRYARAADLAEDLAAFLAGQPVTAVPLDDRGRLARVAAREGYQILGELGRGPRSVVYHALYEPVQRPVALKVYHFGICSREDWEAQLRRGADVWAAVAHPHLVPVHQAGWWDGSPYLAREYVPQGCLASKLAIQAYPVRLALRLVEQLTELVVYLHRQGVIHGNLKPSNVLFAADEIPRVADFRLTGGLFQGQPPINDESPAGLCYLAPELAQRPDREPRQPSDIYGLGVILYELLTGRPPFTGSSAREVLDQVRSQDPVPPSRLNSEVAPHLEAFCLRCLRKSPWRRFGRVYDVLLRLRSIQDEPDTTSGSSDRWRRRRPPGQGDRPDMAR